MMRVRKNGRRARGSAGRPRRGTLSAAVAAAGIMTMVALATAGPVGAAGTGSYTPSPVPVTLSQDRATVTVTYDFGEANTAVFFDVCHKPSSDPTFTLADCDQAAQVAANGSPDGTGQKEYLIPVGSTLASQYIGYETDFWGCYPDGYPVPAGYTEYDQCYLRVAPQLRNNNDDALDLPIVYAVSGNEIPEASVVVLPALLAAALVGGFVFFNRRRSSVA